MKENYRWLLLILALSQVSQVHAEDLMTVYQQALAFDPELQIAGLKVEVGAAQKGQALGGMLPQITATTSWSENNQKTANNPNPDDLYFDATKHFKGNRYNVALSQSLFDFAKFWDWRRAQDTEDQYALENIVAQHDLMFNVVERYFNVLEAEDQLYYLQAEIDTTVKQLEQVKRQYVKQLVLITDVYEVESRLDKLRADEIEAETLVVIAKEALKEKTNTEPVGLYKLSDKIEFNKLDGKLEEWIEVAKSENPIMTAQLKAIEAASSNVKVQKSKHLPVVDLQLTYIQTNQGFNNIGIGNEYETTSGGINVSIPLFSGGVTTNQMYEAQHKLSISENDNQAKIRALIKETSDAFLTSNAGVKRVSASRKAVESAIKSRESLETSFRYGDQTIGDVLNAQQDEFHAKRDLAIAKYTYIKNKIRFMRSIGLISVENLIEVNSWLNVMPTSQERAIDEKASADTGLH